jgi:DNA uptake protein ComE-like DNA-binding protein
MEFSVGYDSSLYKVVDGKLIIREESEVMTDPATKKVELDKKKNEIDKLIREKQRTLYTYKDHVYYPDERLMNAIATAHPFRPDDHTLDVKTAEKLPDGANNVWETLNKAELAELSMGFLQRQADIWEYGSRVLKGKLNDIFTDTEKTVKDIQGFDIESGWPV